MKQFHLLFVGTLLLIGTNANAQSKSSGKLPAAIITNNSSHIARITKDSVIVATGSTFSFTVDTPEDSGLVTTNTTVQKLLTQITSKNGEFQQYKVTTKDGIRKDAGNLVTGDRLEIMTNDGTTIKVYKIGVQPMALSGRLRLVRDNITANTHTSITLQFTAGQRSPNTTVRISIPAGINITGDNTTVNVIGRGAVKLNELGAQSIGRVGTKYPYKKVGDFAITPLPNGGTQLLFKHLDLRPANGADLEIMISNVNINKAGKYPFKANYSTSKPEILTSAGNGTETATLTVTQTIADLTIVPQKNLQYSEKADTYTRTQFSWGPIKYISPIQLMQSTDDGKTWIKSKAIVDGKKGIASISGLLPDKLYNFRLEVKDGIHKGMSNPVQFYSGKMDIKSFGVVADEITDNTDKINEAIDYINKLGGGTLLFSPGNYNVRTIHLQSNVYLFVAKGATIKAIKGADAPETTWFSDRKYRSGLSPTDEGPYADPENYMTKQDVGHHYFRNTMFFGERLDNVKIIGNGYITGNGNLVTGDNVMKNAPDNRADKMFTLKLCTNIEIGGLHRSEDLWYDADKDEPYYINKDGSKKFRCRQHVAD